MALGDSKTQSNTWLVYLVNDLDVTAEQGWSYANGGIPNTTIADAAANISTIMAGLAPAGTVTDVLCNWGVNDVPHDDGTGNTWPLQATWTANYLTVLDAIHARWPGATVRVSKPWCQLSDTNTAILGPWIDAVVAARSTFTRVGDNERDWLKPNVATYTYDGTHYSTPDGMRGKASASKTAMGY